MHLSELAELPNSDTEQKAKYIALFLAVQFLDILVGSHGEASEIKNRVKHETSKIVYDGAERTGRLPSHERENSTRRNFAWTNISKNYSKE